MKQYTIEDFAGFEKNEWGYTICPPGDYTAIKEFPGKCSFGEYCSFGEHCSFGKGCKCEGDKEFKELFTVGYIGSRKGTTYFWYLPDGSILVRCGCFCGNLDEFAAKVEETHGDNQHAKEYMAAIELVKVRFGKEGAE